jgi:TRAP-type C4-dicarboxylate transport system permease large subunit
MIVYGVTANVSIAQLFIAGVIPGVLLAALFSGYIIVWALAHPGKIPAISTRTTIAEKIYASRHLVPVVLLIVLVLARSTWGSRPQPRPPRSVSSAR